MKRINFYLTENEICSLKKESDNKGIATSDLLRRIIDNYFEYDNCYFENIPTSGNFFVSGNTLIL